MDEETIDLQTFASEFLSLARKKLTGTYKVVCADGKGRYLLLQEGSIVDIDTREEFSLLTSAILCLGRTSDRELRKARKAQAKSGATLGAVLLSQTSLNEEELLGAVRSRITDEICALFGSGVRETSFIGHGPEERVEDFAGELSEVLEVLGDPEELFLEAARSLDRWDLVERNFSLLRDVFYATPGAFKYFREESRYSQEVVIIGLVDGRRDVSEVIEESLRELGSSINHFLAFSIARTLIARGELELINPVQMFQLGVECYDDGQHEKALKLFNRAAERGLDDFDLGFKIAQTHEALRQREVASAKYLEFGDKCLARFRPDDAIRCYRKVCELEPGNLGMQVKLLKVLIQENRLDEALSMGILVAGRYASSGKAREGLELVLDLRRRGFKDERLAEKVMELAELCRDEPTLRAERERLANDFCAKKDVEKALEMYQQMFCDGNGSPEVRLKLIDLHLERGDRKLALEHIKALLALGESDWVKDDKVLPRLHRLVCELKPGDARSNRWLVDYHLRSGDFEAAARVLRNLASHLERKGEYQEAALVLKQVLQLDVNNLECMWRLETAYSKIGKTAERIQELRKIAQLATHKNDVGQAERALGEILKASPFDVEARKALGDLCSLRGETSRAVAWFKEVALLDLLAGNLPEAQDYCRRLLVLEPRDPEIIHKFGALCRTVGDDQKAIEQLVKAARLHIENRNLGIAREALANVLQLRPTNAEALELKRSLEELEARLEERSGREPDGVPEAGAGQGADTLFQPAAAVIKKSLAGITARLRNLKSGESSPVRVPEEPAAAQPADSEGGAGDDLSGPPDSAGAAPPGPGGEPAPEDEAHERPAGVSNAASRLKALAAEAKGATQRAQAAGPARDEARPDDDDPPERPLSLKGAGTGIPAETATRSPVPAEMERSSPMAPAHPEALELERFQAALKGETASREGGPASGGEGRSLVKSAELLAKLRRGGRPSDAPDGGRPEPDPRLEPAPQLADRPLGPSQ